ncbi:unnamed protein product [Schistosoma curassoni]|uniref:Transposase n=1 Tax=Schistosoma curassoni TaxID=6186 RepID=A0A183L547_9TREM|nr:unnamed protein product [Schistosoma curassoni]
MQFDDFLNVLGYHKKITIDDETLPREAEKPKRAAKRKFNDYLCAFEELEVEAGFAPLDFPVFNVLTGKFLPIANAKYPEKEVEHAMDVASQGFSHDAKDKVQKRGSRSEETASLMHFRSLIKNGFC